jgi:hypothetical protein
VNRDELIDMAVREAMRISVNWKIHSGCTCLGCVFDIWGIVKHDWPSILSRAEENAG